MNSDSTKQAPIMVAVLNAGQGSNSTNSVHSLFCPALSRHRSYAGTAHDWRPRMLLWQHRSGLAKLSQQTHEVTRCSRVAMCSDGLQPNSGGL